MKWSDLLRLRQQAASRPEEWHTRGPNIYAKDVLIAQCISAEIAQLLTALHSAFIPLVNLAIMQGKKLRDNHAIKK